jgi:hypothetical protein
MPLGHRLDYIAKEGPGRLVNVYGYGGQGRVSGWSEPVQAIEGEKKGWSLFLFIKARLDSKRLVMV